DVGLVDHVADQIGGQGGAAGRQGHEHERDGIAAPMRQPLLQEQAPDQGEDAITFVVIRRVLGILHSSSKGFYTSPRGGLKPPAPCCTGQGGSCPLQGDFSSVKARKCRKIPL